ncbi:uncharacterized protein LOC143692237 isoform X2 [Agelaius phoeniceus]|uniref:uncharacterized protein LOC143692237 isoform X2 n=1 Tax=Agelaius phoeniceus TaxID=39638 RepID=UPI004054A0B7
MLGMASRPPNPPLGQPDTLLHHGGQRRPPLVQEPSGGRGRGRPGRAAVESSAAPRPADSRRPQPPHREAQTPTTRGSSSLPEAPPRNLFCPHRRTPRGRHPRRHRECSRRLPGGCRGAPSRRAAVGRAAAEAASAATFTAPSRGGRVRGFPGTGTAERTLAAAVV